MAMYTGTARISISMTMNTISNPGLPPTARRSIAAPDTTKKIGMKKPYEMPSSRVSKVCDPSGITYRRMNPAAKAPNTTSRSNIADTVTSVMSSSTVRRMSTCSEMFECLVTSR